jgi:hypothetical protein
VDETPAYPLNRNVVFKGLFERHREVIEVAGGEARNVVLPRPCPLKLSEPFGGRGMLRWKRYG